MPIDTPNLSIPADEAHRPYDLANDIRVSDVTQIKPGEGRIDDHRVASSKGVLSTYEPRFGSAYHSTGEMQPDDLIEFNGGQMTLRQAMIHGLVERLPDGSYRDLVELDQPAPAAEVSERDPGVRVGPDALAFLTNAFATAEANGTSSAILIQEFLDNPGKPSPTLVRLYEQTGQTISEQRLHHDQITAAMDLWSGIADRLVARNVLGRDRVDQFADWALSTPGTRAEFISALHEALLRGDGRRIDALGVAYGKQHGAGRTNSMAGRKVFTKNELIYKNGQHVRSDTEYVEIDLGGGHRTTTTVAAARAAGLI